LGLLTHPDHALLLHAEDKIAAIKQQEEILRKVITEMLGAGHTAKL
jgi:hypothetical protein